MADKNVAKAAKALETIKKALASVDWDVASLRSNDISLAREHFDKGIQYLEGAVKHREGW